MSTLNHDTELEPRNLRRIIVDHTSEMLDNPDKYGIYPTGKFYNDLEAALHTYLYKQTLRLIPKDWPIDPNNNSPLNTFNKARNSAYAEMRRAAAERWGQE